MFETLKNILNHFIFKKYSISFTQLKENLPIILIIPTSLGGIWQLLELSNLGIPYIRFFSVTQLLPDGLVIIFMTLALMFFMMNPASIYENKSFEHHCKYSISQLIKIIIFNSLILFMFIFFLYKIH
ncbi:hypothetical protein OHV73_19020, partial [Acinetobacter baumannii]|nr:hypothetical protein [Acinetobacter baumannii]